MDSGMQIVLGVVGAILLVLAYFKFIRPGKLERQVRSAKPTISTPLGVHVRLVGSAQVTLSTLKAIDEGLAELNYRAAICDPYPYKALVPGEQHCAIVPATLNSQGKTGFEDDSGQRVGGLYLRGPGIIVIPENIDNDLGFQSAICRHEWTHHLDYTQNKKRYKLHKGHKTKEPFALPGC